MQFERITTEAGAVAVMLLSAVVLSFIVCTVMLMCGVSVGAWMFPAALFLSVLHTGIFCDKKIGYRWIAIGVAIIVCSVAVMLAFPDYSYDGVYYHQETVSALLDGWNPYRAGRTDPYGLWTCHYVRGIETAGATVSAATGRIDVCRSVNLMLIVSTVLFVYVFLRSRYPLWTKGRSISVSVACVCGTVVMAQSLAGYVDYVKYLCILLTLIFIERQRKSDDYLSAVLLAEVIVLAVSVKFNIFFDEVIWLVVSVLWLWRRKEGRVASRILVISAAGVCLGVLLNWQPYFTNWTDHGHPLYPLLGEGAADIMTGNTPVQYAGGGRISNFFRSLFSFSLPTYGVRSGGFGPLMPAILALCVLIAVKERERISAGQWGIIVLSLISCFFFDQSWWARYQSQLWLVPALLLAVGYSSSHSRRLSQCLLLMMLASGGMALSCGVYSAWNHGRYWDAMYEGIGETGVRIVNDRSQIRRHLKEHDVDFIQAEDTCPDCNGGELLYYSGYSVRDPRLLLSASQSERYKRACESRGLDYNKRLRKCHKEHLRTY